MLVPRQTFGAIIGLIDVAISKPVSSGNAFSFADLADFYLRFKKQDIDLILALQDVQEVVFNEVRLERSDLLRIWGTVESRCRAANSRLQMTVTTGLLSSISGPNPRREFIAEVSALLTPK